MPARRKKLDLSLASHRTVAVRQQVRTEWQRQNIRANVPCHEVATSTSDGNFCSSRFSSIRHVPTSPSQRHAARRASRPACFNARCNCARDSMRVASSPPGPPRGTLPHPCPAPCSRGPRAPFVSSQWSCSHSSSVACNVLNAASIAGSQFCMFRERISVRASLIMSWSSYCVLSLAFSMVAATEYIIRSCSPGFACRQKWRGTATRP
mmetsp:Transcript_100730/g.285509  ORF Transcript_100730/g.285509 Transcript_100730/m.285509 type:complete len:208 (+) Transcript_100730:790-1413(+)